MRSCKSGEKRRSSGPTMALRDGRRLSTLPPDDLANLQDALQQAVLNEGWKICPDQHGRAIVWRSLMPQHVAQACSPMLQAIRKPNLPKRKAFRWTPQSHGSVVAF